MRIVGADQEAAGSHHWRGASALSWDEAALSGDESVFARDELSRRDNPGATG
jgi:hypothetical protein